MTCIIALRQQNGVFIGTDSAWTGGTIDTTTNSKIHKYGGGLLAGFSGSKSFQNEMSLYNIKAPLVQQSLEEIWQCVKFVAPSDKSKQISGEMLITDGNIIAYFGNIAGYNIVQEEFYCLGTGGGAASGAMSALSNETDPETRIKKSLEITAKHCWSSVAPPFCIEFVERK